MAAFVMEELVSQAEKERVTLAEMISRTMTPEQLDELQNGLRVELASNYGEIEIFMRDVRVPSLEELMGFNELTDSDPATGDNAFAMGVSDDTV